MRKGPIPAVLAEGWKGVTNYPEPFASLVAGRTKKPLGHLFGLTNFGVNLTVLDPGAVSALFHFHSKQDEFIYVVQGSPTLAAGDEEYLLAPGDCMGFRAGSGIGHQLLNRSNQPVTYLEIGDRSPDDEGVFPNDDIKGELAPDGSWKMFHKDGTPY